MHKIAGNKIAKTGFIAFAVAALVCIAGLLAGCAGQQGSSGASSSEAASAHVETEQRVVRLTSLEPGNLGRVLVAYYSATGNTKAVAEEIAGALEADLFEITPATPYTEADLNWESEDSRVYKEHEDAAMREVALVKVTPDDFAEYDTVFIGYPIWWGSAAWPVNGFVSGNSFEGKTVIPFCTSSSSAIGTSGTELEKLAGTGSWLPGQRFSTSPDAEEVREWALSM